LFSAARHDLSQLDEGRAEVLQHVAHRFGDALVDQRLLAPVDNSLKDAANRPEGRCIEDNVAAVADDRVDGLGDAQVFGEDVAPADGQPAQEAPITLAARLLVTDRAFQTGDALQKEEQEGHQRAGHDDAEPDRVRHRKDIAVVNLAKAQFIAECDKEDRNIDEKHEQAKRPEHQLAGDQQQDRPEHPVDDRKDAAQDYDHDRHDPWLRFGRDDKVDAWHQHNHEEQRQCIDGKADNEVEHGTLLWVWR
jgi:hypothetical protein